MYILWSKGTVIIYRQGGCWGGDNFRGDHLIFGRTKGGISCNWEPKRGDHWKLWKDSGWGPLKFAWKMKTWRGGGGSRKTSKVISGAGSLQWSNIQRGDRVNFTLFSPKSSPRPPQAINNDQSLIQILLSPTFQKPGRIFHPVARSRSCWDSGYFNWGSTSMTALRCFMVLLSIFVLRHLVIAPIRNTKKQPLLRMFFLTNTFIERTGGLICLFFTHRKDKKAKFRLRQRKRRHKWPWKWLYCARMTWHRTWLRPLTICLM